MPRTVRRQPFNISTSSNNFPETQSFTHAEFKGICDSKNDTLVESTTFASASNVYLDDNSLLISRPPFKFEDGETGIIEQWLIGDYGFRLYREVTIQDGISVLKFTLSCITHECTNEPEATLSVNDVGLDYVPKIAFAPIEDKIFVWFGGINFLVFDTVTLSFKNGMDNVYLPVHKLVTNNIENDFETKNFLTDAYRRRYQYSALSSVNFEMLSGRDLSVSVNNGMTQSASKHLYDIKVQPGQEKVLIYPYSSIGNNYYVDVVQTPRAVVVLRYSIVLHSIEISFDGKMFSALPRLENILGEPMLTRDGLYAVAFTASGVARCKLVASETDDTSDDIGVWITKPYLERNLVGGLIANATILTSFVPRGYFETIDQFAYVIRVQETDNLVRGQYLYTEYLSGMNGTQWGCTKLEEQQNGVSVDTLSSDDIKVYAKYIPPTIKSNTIRMIVSIIAKKTSIKDTDEGHWSTNCVINYYFKETAEFVNRVLREGDRISLIDREGNFSLNNNIVDTEYPYAYVYKIDASHKNALNERADILPGDEVIFTALPIEYENASFYISGTTYNPGDAVLHKIVDGYPPYLCICKKTTTTITGLKDENWDIYSLYLPFAGYIANGISLEIYGTQRMCALLTNKSGTRYIYNGENKSGFSASFSPVSTTYMYSLDELDTMFPSMWKQTGLTVIENKKPSEIFSTHLTSYPTKGDIFSGYLQIEGVKNPAQLYRRKYHGLVYTSGVYPYTDIIYPMRNMDISIEIASTDTDIYYNTFIAYNIVDITHGNRGADTYREIVYNFTQDKTTHDRKSVLGNSAFFKILTGTMSALTSTYLYRHEDYSITDLPNLTKSSFIVDKEHIVSNGDCLSILSADMSRVLYSRNVYRLDDNFYLSPGVIESGDIVTYVESAVTERDYLFPVLVNDGVYDLYTSNFFYIEKLNGDAVVTGPIHMGDTIRLRPYDKDISLPAGHPGNPSATNIYVEPFSDEIFTGKAYVSNFVQPLAIYDSGIWCNVNGDLWTSMLDTNTILELDEYINCNMTNDKPIFDLNLAPPDFVKTLNEHYFVYNTETNTSLQVSQTKRDEDKLFTGEDIEFLLYLPKKNEQKFVNKITNLHPLSNTEMGVFTEKELWYISTIVGEDGTVVYTKPILSKTPAGCRYGSDVITALDGQALIFCTPRGVSALAPQDFIATTEKSLSYLSDAIQEKYDRFYHDAVDHITNTLLNKDPYTPQIKIATYKYWILFHKFMDREILVLDTRNGGWWSWTTPYPIKSLTVGTRLHALMQIDFSPLKDRESLSGVSFLFADREAMIVTDTSTQFPELGDTPIANIGYYDDTVDEAINGLSELVYENEFVGYRHLIKYASPVIDWHFTSQKLHFNQINNYKTVKSFVVNVKGDEIFGAKISTKAFRDTYHPEQTSVIEVKVNDIRTFVKRMNLMHTINFQYKFENDADTLSQLRLNALSIKYEVKENIR